MPERCVAVAMGDDDVSILRTWATTDGRFADLRPFATRSRGNLMNDMSAIAGLTTSLRAAVEIMKGMNDTSDINLITTKIFELTREIMSAQACALAVQSEQFDLLQGKRGLEEEIVRLKVWNTEKYRYELKNVAPGATAYVVKANMQGSEPTHWICANCFQSGKKRFLNESHSDLHFVYHKCQECAGKIRIRKVSLLSEQALAG
jgi:hypothetical protein